MTKKKNKRIDICKLPRKELLVMCKGRGITIGRLEAKVKRLEDAVTAAPETESLLNAYAEIEQLKQKYAKLDEGYDLAVQDIRDGDILLGETERKLNQANGAVSNLENQTVSLKAEVEEKRNLLAAEQNKHKCYAQLAEAMVARYSLALRSVHDLTDLALMPPVMPTTNKEE